MYNRRQSYKVVIVWIWIFIKTHICTAKHRSTFFRFLSVLETQEMMLKKSNFFLKHFLFSPSSLSGYADKIFMKYLFHRAFKTGFPYLRAGTGNRNVGMGYALCINSNASWGKIVGFITEFWKLWCIQMQIPLLLLYRCKYMYMAETEKRKIHTLSLGQCIGHDWTLTLNLLTTYRSIKAMTSLLVSSP